jgi:uncharacterized protein (DUF58 family)
MIESDVLDRLRSLDITVQQRVEGVLQGDHRGLLPGSGRTPGEARPYVPGDDVRRIDWNVTARAQRPYVRDTESDHELEVTLIADVSASMDFGTSRGTKRDAALATCAVFGFASAVGGNRVGAVIIGRSVRRVRARAGRSHVYGVLGAIDRAMAGSADLAAGLTAAAQTRSRRGLVVVASDFHDVGNWERPLRMLTHRHEVVAAVVTDPRELGLPDVGVVRMEDPESGRQRWVETGSKRFRRRFGEVASRRQRDLERRIIGAGASHLPVGTDRDWVGDVIAWAVGRRASLVSAAGTA